MKKNALFLLLFLAQLSPAQTPTDKWPNLTIFHEVLSQTFHPSEKGDLAPIKARSLELAQKAQDLNQKSRPEAFNTPKILEATGSLQEHCWALHKKIKLGANDAEITKLLAEIHDMYHDIAGLCQEQKK